MYTEPDVSMATRPTTPFTSPLKPSDAFWANDVFVQKATSEMMAVKDAKILVLIIAILLKQGLGEPLREVMVRVGSIY